VAKLKSLRRLPFGSCDGVPLHTQGVIYNYRIWDRFHKPVSVVAARMSLLEGKIRDPKMNRIFRERVQSHDKDNIMNIDDYVKMISKEEGLEEGKREGRKEGVEKSKRLFVENLLSNTDFTVKKIASLANVTIKFVNQIKNESKAK
jgi:predicted transposase/invertase (TIGR01784 family)